MTETQAAYHAALSGRIKTPIGEGAIVSNAGEGQYLVLFSRKEHTPEAWLKISPNNGPCVFRVFDAEELEAL